MANNIFRILYYFINFICVLKNNELSLQSQNCSMLKLEYIPAIFVRLKIDNSNWWYKYKFIWYVILYEEMPHFITHYTWSVHSFLWLSLLFYIFLTELYIYYRGYTQSLYLKLRNRNRCNHRDYQNISRNGIHFSLLKYFKQLQKKTEKKQIGLTHLEACSKQQGTSRAV